MTPTTSWMTKMATCGTMTLISRQSEVRYSSSTSTPTLAQFTMTTKSLGCPSVRSIATTPCGQTRPSHHALTQLTHLNSTQMLNHAQRMPTSLIHGFRYHMNSRSFQPTSMKEHRCRLTPLEVHCSICPIKTLQEVIK
jgi:hypothetical protein